MIQFLEALSLEGKLLLVLDQQDRNVELSVRNIPHVSTCIWDVLNVYDLLGHDKIVITESAVEKLQTKYFQPTSGGNGRETEQ